MTITSGSRRTGEIRSTEAITSIVVEQKEMRKKTIQGATMHIDLNNTLSEVTSGSTKADIEVTAHNNRSRRRVTTNIVGKSIKSGGTRRKAKEVFGNMMLHSTACNFQKSLFQV